MISRDSKMNFSKITNASDLIVEYLQTREIDKVFCVSGGSIHNIIASIDKSTSIDLVPWYHEQGAVFAAKLMLVRQENQGWF